MTLRLIRCKDQEELSEDDEAYIISSRDENLLDSCWTCKCYLSMQVSYMQLFAIYASAVSVKAEPDWVRLTHAMYVSGKAGSVYVSGKAEPDRPGGLYAHLHVPPGHGTHNAHIVLGYTRVHSTIHEGIQFST